MRVAVDVGYGFTKVCAANSGRAVFASTLSQLIGTGEGLRVVGSGHDGHVLNVLRAGGQPESWQVGSMSGSRSWQTDASQREGYDVLLFAALALAGADGNVEVSVGVPVTLFLQKDQRRALKARLTGLDAWVGVDGQDARRIRVAEVTVWPQAAGAVVHAMGDDSSLVEKPLGLIDIGFRTTDFIVMRKTGGALAPDESLAGSVDLGIGMAYESVRARIEREYGVLVPQSEVERAEAEYGGRMWVRGIEVDAGGILREEVASISSRIAGEIRRAWGSTLDLLGTVLLAGGGAAAAYRSLTTLTPAIRLVRDPLWANVEGYLTLARPTTVHPSSTSVR